MGWAYVQIASLVGLVMLVLYIAVADYRLNKEKETNHS